MEHHEGVRWLVMCGAVLLCCCDRVQEAPPSATPPTPPANADDPSAVLPASPEPDDARAKPSTSSLSVALKADWGTQVVTLTDGSVLVHREGRLARVEAGRLMEVTIPPTEVQFREAVLHDQVGGRWPDAVFACWMKGMPNEPGNPTLLRLAEDGWRRVKNGRGKKRWCYEGFAQTPSGSLISRRIAHDFEREAFALSGQFIVDPKRPGFVAIEGDASIPDPKMAFVADWAMLGEQLWAVTGEALVQISGEGAPRSIALPDALADTGAGKTILLHADHDALYVHGWGQGAAVLARLRGDALQPIDLPRLEGMSAVAAIEATPTGALWMVTGTRGWAEIDEGKLWFRPPGETWAEVDARDPSAFDPADADADWHFNHVWSIAAEGEHAWVAAQSSHYGRASMVVLTTRPVDAVIDWVPPDPS